MKKGVKPITKEFYSRVNMGVKSVERASEGNEMNLTVQRSNSKYIWEIFCERACG